jgi:hypothetical protein
LPSHVSILHVSSGMVNRTVATPMVVMAPAFLVSSLISACIWQRQRLGLAVTHKLLADSCIRVAVAVANDPMIAIIK